MNARLFHLKIILITYSRHEYYTLVGIVLLKRQLKLPLGSKRSRVSVVHGFIQPVFSNVHVQLGSIINPSMSNTVVYLEKL